MISENRYNIKITDYKVGKDYLFLITGGVEHIGAMAVAYWDENQLKKSTVELPHHKEGELSKECAELAANSLKRTCTVVMGIHIDNASLNDINYIVNFVRNEMNNTISGIIENER